MINYLETVYLMMCCWARSIEVGRGTVLRYNYFTKMAVRIQKSAFHRE